MKTALLIIDHGSRRAEANEMLNDVVELVRKLRPGVLVEAAHMELAEPTIEQGIAACVEQGAEAVVAHPYMLSRGRHAVSDIPQMVHDAAAKHPGLEVCVTEPLGIHEKIAEVILERAGLDS